MKGGSPTDRKHFPPSTIEVNVDKVSYHMVVKLCQDTSIWLRQVIGVEQYTQHVMTE